MLRLLGLFVLVYVGLIVFYVFAQRGLIYYPQTASAESLLQNAGSLEAVRDHSGDIIAWRGGDLNAQQRFLVFHGNAGHAQHRRYLMELFAETDPAWEVVVMEYPGYGSRRGSASETAFFQAAETLFQQLTQNDERPVYLLGESIGSGPVAHLAEHHPEAVAGLLLITPFTRLADVGRHHFPWLPVATLLRDRYDNVAALADYRGRVAVVTAENDSVVPAKFGRQLYETLSGPSEYFEIPATDHNNIHYHPETDPWQQSVEFLVQESQ